MWIVGQFSAIFVGMFNAFLVYSIRFLTWRLALVAAWVALVAAGVAVIVGYFGSLFDQLIAKIPGVDLIAMFIPSTMGFCITLVIGAHVVHASYLLAARLAAHKAKIFAA